jgi:hypothetical protein
MGIKRTLIFVTRKRFQSPISGHSPLRLPFIHCQIVQRFSTLPFDRLPNLLTSRREAAFESIRPNVQSVPAHPEIVSIVFRHLPPRQDDDCGRYGDTYV